MDTFASFARQMIERCRALAGFTEQPGFTTRTFLSPPMRQVHAELRAWMEQAGMTVSIDSAGNMRGCYASTKPAAKRMFFGSHIDTVPHAGAFDGVLGVLLAIALVELSASRRFRFHIEVIAFSEEEGVRFSVPFIGSRAVAGDISDTLVEVRDANGISVREAIRDFGLDPTRIGDAQAGTDALGYFEFHIEQGPILESLDLPLGIVETIVGQTRADIVFHGNAGHAGTTPMSLRHDALAGAAEWVTIVEREAKGIPGLVATVGRLNVDPGADNVIAASARASLDLRHATDTIRRQTFGRLLTCAEQVASRRGLRLTTEPRLDQPSVAMNETFVGMLDRAVENSGYPIHRMSSGAGHDAMIMARRMPAAMLFLRTPGGISHHPDENVLVEDVEAALRVGKAWLQELENMHG